MARIVAIDAGVIGLLCTAPATAAACSGWLLRTASAGTVVVLPDLAVYEARRGESLDADAILAAVSGLLRGPGDTSIIATTNVRHLERFPGVIAMTWEDIQ